MFIALRTFRIDRDTSNMPYCDVWGIALKRMTCTQILLNFFRKTIEVVIKVVRQIVHSVLNSFVSLLSLSLIIPDMQKDKYGKHVYVQFSDNSDHVIIHFRGNNIIT